MPGKISVHHELEVYQRAFAAAMQIFELSKSFPKEETYSLTVRFADLHEVCLRTWPRHGANGDTRSPSSAS